MENHRGSVYYAVALSRDHRWIVSGVEGGASVWDAKTHDKVVQVSMDNFVVTVDISPDSTRFTTGTASSRKTGLHLVNIWDITNGERLVGPLEHEGAVIGVKFSPNGSHIATVTQTHHIRIFNSTNGDQLVVIDNPMPEWSAITPLAWSSDGQQLFAISEGGKIKSFNTSTGSPLAEWQIHDNSEDLVSIALSSNDKFIASFANHSISFWDTSSHARLGSILKDVDRIRSIALSPNGRHLATGGFNKTITIWDLSSVLPESYLPLSVSTTFLSSGN